MTKPWNRTTLGECTIINTDTYSPKEGWPFINYLETGQITDNSISDIHHLTVGVDKIPASARRKIRSGDIVYSTVRPNKNHYGMIKNLPDNFLVSTAFAVIRGKPYLADTSFIYYYITQKRVIDFFHTLAEHSSSAYPSLQMKDLEILEIMLPPIEEQQVIAHILETLDDKIELNRRMNDTLEEMARALFKSWFVDFDPVRAKMDGRWKPDQSLPGLPAELYDFFPNCLVHSELGEIPLGWKVNKIDKCYDLTMGQSPPGTAYNDNGVGLPFFQGRKDFGFRYPSKRIFCSAPIKIARTDDTLVSVRAPVGDINMAWEKCCIGRGLVALRHKTGLPSFTYYSIWSLQNQLRQYEHTGTVFGSINQKQLKELLTIDIPSNLISIFEKRIILFDKKIKCNIMESQILVALRDTLLPKLLSGEIRVDELGIEL